ncbi:proline-rich receptor-like protein kinase PERK9 [Esox lucius]|uniref:proline-rich receptor-like protein kinase PERK9 n=1 Tax=Esox lucius TaxID=8010 RepID=UPI001476C44D|nr:proline-rich receptor-like protein kinase PERK9 [Esox lucius]
MRCRGVRVEKKMQEVQKKEEYSRSSPTHPAFPRIQPSHASSSPTRPALPPIQLSHSSSPPTCPAIPPIQPSHPSSPPIQPSHPSSFPTPPALPPVQSSHPSSFPTPPALPSSPPTPPALPPVQPPAETAGCRAAGRTGAETIDQPTVNLTEMNSNYPACGLGGHLRNPPKTPPPMLHHNTALDNHQPKHRLIDSNWASLLWLWTDEAAEARRCGQGNFIVISRSSTD